MKRLLAIGSAFVLIAAVAVAIAAWQANRYLDTPLSGSGGRTDVRNCSGIGL